MAQWPRHSGELAFDTFGRKVTWVGGAGMFDQYYYLISSSQKKNYYLIFFIVLFMIYHGL